MSDDEQILKGLEKEAEQKAQDLQDAQTRLGQLKQHVEDLKNASQIFVKADAAEKKRIEEEKNDEAIKVKQRWHEKNDEKY